MPLVLRRTPTWCLAHSHQRSLPRTSRSALNYNSLMWQIISREVIKEIFIEGFPESIRHTTCSSRSWKRNSVVNDLERRMTSLTKLQIGWRKTNMLWHNESSESKWKQWTQKRPCKYYRVQYVLVHYIVSQDLSVSSITTYSPFDMTKHLQPCQQTQQAPQPMLLRPQRRLSVMHTIAAFAFLNHTSRQSTALLLQNGVTLINMREVNLPRLRRRPWPTQPNTLLTQFPRKNDHSMPSKQRSIKASNFWIPTGQQTPSEATRRLWDNFFRESKAKDTRLVTFSALDHPHDDVGSDVTPSDSSTTSHMTRGSVQDPWANMNSVQETVTIVRNPTRLTPLQEPFSTSYSNIVIRRCGIIYLQANLSGTNLRWYYAWRSI